MEKCEALEAYRAAESNIEGFMDTSEIAHAARIWRHDIEESRSASLPWSQGYISEQIAAAKHLISIFRYYQRSEFEVDPRVASGVDAVISWVRQNHRGTTLTIPRIDSHNKSDPIADPAWIYEVIDKECNPLREPQTSIRLNEARGGQPDWMDEDWSALLPRNLPDGETPVAGREPDSMLR